MSVLNILYMAAIAACLRVPTLHALHMFQQNRYECRRFTAWIKDQKDRIAVRARTPVLVFLIGAVTVFSVSRQIAGWILLAIAAGLAYLENSRERKARYIKPLVFTGRVKRQTAVLILLDLIWIILLGMNANHWNWWLMLVLSYLSPWILIYPMAWITSPIEESVKKGYRKEAEKILKEHSDLIRIGITGSYGKTSTKNIMQAVLSERFNSLMTPASYNTPMGITRTVREMLKPIHQVFICEMGADHVNDITELMNFVHPTIGVVTSIGPQHLNTFKTMDNIVHEKMQMIECLPADGVGIVNADNEYINAYQRKNPVPVITCAIHNPDADYRAENISYSPEGSSFQIVHENKKVDMKTHLLGELNILNILFAAAAARYLGVEWPAIQKAVREMKYVEHRLEVKKINGFTFIDDAFNANPSGSAMALDVLKGMPGKRFIVTPGMIDLGEKQESLNHAFGMKMKDHADQVILVGEMQTKPVYEGLKESGFDMQNVHVTASEKEAFQMVYSMAERTDTILLENDLPDAFSR